MLKFSNSVSEPLCKAPHGPIVNKYAGRLERIMKQIKISVGSIVSRHTVPLAESPSGKRKIAHLQLQPDALLVSGRHNCWLTSSVKKCDRALHRLDNSGWQPTLWPLAEQNVHVDMCRLSSLAAFAVKEEYNAQPP